MALGPIFLSDKLICESLCGLCVASINIENRITLESTVSPTWRKQRGSPPAGSHKAVGAALRQASWGHVKGGREAPGDRPELSGHAAAESSAGSREHMGPAPHVAQRPPSRAGRRVWKAGQRPQSTSPSPHTGPACGLSALHGAGVLPLPPPQPCSTNTPLRTTLRPPCGVRGAWQAGTCGTSTLCPTGGSVQT